MVLRRRPSDALLLILAMGAIAGVLLSVLLLRQAVAGDGMPLPPAVVQPAPAAAGNGR